MLSCILVGKSVILVSDEPSKLTLIGESLRVLLQPLQWKVSPPFDEPASSFTMPKVCFLNQHLYLPFCPFAMASSVSALENFKEGSKPFLIGFDAIVNIQKPRDDHRYRLRMYWLTLLRNNQPSKLTFIFAQAIVSTASKRYLWSSSFPHSV